VSREGIRVERGVGKREQVEALIYGYAELLDAGDLAGVAALFDQASYCFGEDVVISGSEELLAIMQATVILYDGSPRTQHVTGNLILEFDDDSCLDWADPTPCGDTQRCDAGACEDREAGDECANDGQCGDALGLCDFGTCIEAYGRFWEVIVATGHVAEPFGDYFDDPDPIVIITVNDEEFRTEVVSNERNPSWFQSFHIFIRRGDPFRWRLSDSDLLGEERVGAWEFGEGVPISTLRTGSLRSFADDETSFVSLFFFPSDGPPEDE
jgi:hypothetical protein